VIIVLTCLIAIAVIAFVLTVRPQDLPDVEPPSPFRHLDERKAAIYENLRDLQFEYRVGKLSDADYQHTKQDLQKELAAVMAEVDKLQSQLNGSAPQAAPPKPQTDSRTCPACGAKFEKQLKFCGECGKPMKVATQ
jgi:NADH pyrophosphatase NudC (nudix superfamily)